MIAHGEGARPPSQRGGAATVGDGRRWLGQFLPEPVGSLWWRRGSPLQGGGRRGCYLVALGRLPLWQAVLG